MWKSPKPPFWIRYLISALLPESASWATTDWTSVFLLESSRISAWYLSSWNTGALLLTSLTVMKTEALLEYFPSVAWQWKINSNKAPGGKFWRGKVQEQKPDLYDQVDVIGGHSGHVQSVFISDGYFSGMWIQRKEFVDVSGYNVVFYLTRFVSVVCHHIERQLKFIRSLVDDSSILGMFEYWRIVVIVLQSYSQWNLPGLTVSFVIRCLEHIDNCHSILQYN